jgi:hypothetical protein
MSPEVTQPGHRRSFSAFGATADVELYRRGCLIQPALRASQGVNYFTLKGSQLVYSVV